MNKFKFLLLGLLSATALNAQQVKWISSTDSDRWNTSNKMKMEKNKTDEAADIVISGKKGQLIEGFGGCFSELGWDALMELPEAERNDVIYKLFSPKEANFTYNRIPMGASDFALSFYSFNEVDDDFDMVNFNIERDRHILLRFIKAAQKENPGMAFFASPWSPPSWMKTNNHYASTTSTKGYNGLPVERSNTRDATAFKMQKGYLEAYALYFSKFIRAYEKEGVPVSVVYMQNEPFSNQVYASCKWRPEDMAYFIGEYLGPKFEEDSIETEIYYGTANTSVADYVRMPLKDPKASKYIRGVGFQWAGKKSLPVIRKEFPHLKYMQTESECGNGRNIWEQAEYTWSLMNHYLANGVSSYAYWNLILDHTGVSRWGWRQNSLISINTETKEVKYNPEYYIMKHVSHFVVPGANLLETNGGADHLAFLNPDGSVVVVIVNTEDAGKEVSVGYQDKIIRLDVKARSFNTIVF